MISLLKHFVSVLVNKDLCCQSKIVGSWLRAYSVIPHHPDLITRHNDYKKAEFALNITLTGETNIVLE